MPTPSKHRALALACTALLTLWIPAWAQDDGDLVIAGRDGVYGEALEYAVDAFLEEHPDANVELLQLPYGNLYETLVISRREATQAHDVVMLDDTWATEFMSNEWLADLAAAGITADDFVSTTADVSRYPYPDGTLFALPFVGNVELFAYRTDLFEAHGLEAPQSWDDVLSAAETIQSSEEDVNGLVFRGAKANPIVSSFMPVFWAHGARVVNDDGEATVDSPEAIEALDVFLQMQQYAPEGVVNYNATELRDALQQGTVAMATEVWPAWVPSLDDPEVSNVVGNVDLMPPPGQREASSPMLGSWLLGVAADANNPELATEFVRFITSAQMQKELALEVGLPPTRVSVYEDAEVLEAYRWYDAVLEALQNSVPRPRITQWSQVETILGDYLQIALIGQMTAEEALTAANREVAAALER